MGEMDSFLEFRILQQAIIGRKARHKTGPGRKGTMTRKQAIF
jgi:hypothetical protein